MLPVLIAFIAGFAASVGIIALFMRLGRNTADELAAARGRRPMMFGPLTEPLAGLLPIREESRKRHQQFLRQAGHYHSSALTEFLALRNAMVVGSALWIVAAIVVLTNPGDPAMYQLGGAGLLVVILLYSLPRLVLESMAKSRMRRIEASLPDALDMVSMCVSAGLPLQHSLTRVSEELQPSHPDLAFEFRLVVRQAEAGSLSAAVQQFAKRLDVPEVHSIATMVWQAEQQGTGITNAFQAFSDQVRLERRQRAEEDGNKKAFKMLFPLVFCLAPAVYLLLLGPAAMQLRDFLANERRPGGVLSREAMQSVSQISTDTTGIPSGAPPAATSPTTTSVVPANR